MEYTWRYQTNSEGKDENNALFNNINNLYIRFHMHFNSYCWAKKHQHCHIQYLHLKHYADFGKNNKWSILIGTILSSQVLKNWNCILTRLFRFQPIVLLCISDWVLSDHLLNFPSCWSRHKTDLAWTIQYSEYKICKKTVYCGSEWSFH
jgi:hypothetical protein